MEAYPDKVALLPRQGVQVIPRGLAAQRRTPVDPSGSEVAEVDELEVTDRRRRPRFVATTSQAQPQPQPH